MRGDDDGIVRGRLNNAVVIDDDDIHAALARHRHGCVVLAATVHRNEQLGAGIGQISDALHTQAVALHAEWQAHVVRLRPTACGAQRQGQDGTGRDAIRVIVPKDADALALLQRAESALDRARVERRDARVFDEATYSDPAATLSLMNEMLLGLERGEIFLTDSGVDVAVLDPIRQALQIDEILAEGLEPYLHSYKRVTPESVAATVPDHLVTASSIISTIWRLSESSKRSGSSLRTSLITSRANAMCADSSRKTQLVPAARP